MSNTNGQNRRTRDRLGEESGIIVFGGGEEAGAAWAGAAYSGSC
jgi:hypothetical protein